MPGRVLVYGGNGALGQVLLSNFKAQGYWTLNLDLTQNPAADANVVLDPNVNWTEQESKALTEAGQCLGGEKLDAVLCVAGGWAGGNAAQTDLAKSSDLMWKQSVWSSTISARIAALHLKEGGLLQLTGAQAALQGTPGMIGYGMAKAAVHQLVQSLAAPSSGLPANVTVVALLPITLDTPMNRKWMSKADFSTWTPREFVANLLLDWTNNSETRPASGSLLQLITKNSKTQVVPA